MLLPEAALATHTAVVPSPMMEATCDGVALRLAIVARPRCVLLCGGLRDAGQAAVPGLDAAIVAAGVESTVRVVLRNGYGKFGTGWVFTSPFQV